MSYDTNNIMKDLDVTKPDGAAEYGSILDNAMKEVKRIMFYGSSVTAVSSYPYTVLITDNTLYCTGAGGTVAAPQLSTISTTGVEKRIVVINDSSAAVIFDPYSTETVAGASTYSVAAGTIAEFLGHGGTDWEIIRDTGKVHDGTALRSASATPAANTVPVSEGDNRLNPGWVDAITDGTNNIHTKIINIGDWNMDATASVSIAHGLTFSKIRSIAVFIRDDFDIGVSDIFTAGTEPSVLAGTSAWNATNIVITRTTGGYFDGTVYDSTSFNRGWITITYVE